MLHRHDGGGLLVISQPSHAWISGQLAANWGNESEGFEPPSKELVIAAEQHDVAWLDWEAKPTLNRATGLPHTFSELPTLQHLNVWSKASSRALSYGRLPALLISMHGTYLYKRFHDFESDTTGEAQEARAFLARELAFQQQILGELATRSDISQESVNTQRRLLSLWDAISLALCMGFDGSRDFPGVPTADRGDITLRLRREDGEGHRFTADPWPFAAGHVELYCEGRRLAGAFDDEQVMRDAISNAPSESLRFTLSGST